MPNPCDAVASDPELRSFLTFADPLASFKTSIEDYLSPAVLCDKPVQISKAKAVIRRYSKAAGDLTGEAELKIFLWSAVIVTHRIINCPFTLQAQNETVLRCMLRPKKKNPSGGDAGAKVLIL
ncbi:MAG: hypothetical protein V1897_14470 [Pseudomonadota bacterium]